MHGASKWEDGEADALISATEAMEPGVRLMLKAIDRHETWALQVLELERMFAIADRPVTTKRKASKTAKASKARKKTHARTR